MEFVDIVATYETELSKFSLKDVTYFESFLRFDNESSIENPSIMNKVLVFGRNQKADTFESFSYWKKHGRVPKKNSGICVLNEENKGTYVFAKGDTVVINPVLADETEVINKEPLQVENVFDEVKELEAIKRLSIAFDENELVQFVSECISIMENRQSHFSDNIAAIYEKYKVSVDSLFGWVVPAVYEAYNELRENKEKEYDTRTFDGRTDSRDELSNRGSDKREFITGADNAVRESEELLSESSTDMDSKEPVVEELGDTKQEVQEEQGNDEPVVIGESKGIDSDEKKSRRAYGNGTDDKDIAKSNVSYIPTSDDYESPYFLGTLKGADGGRFLSAMTKYDATKHAIYGVFPNYKECSAACSFLDKLSDEEKKKYYFDDDREHSDKEYAEKQSLFEADFKEYKDTMNYLKCESKMYHDIIDNAKNENRENTLEEIGEMYLLRNLSAHSNLNELIYDAFHSNLSDEALEEFVGTVIKDALDSYKDWADGEFVKNDDITSFDMIIRPHGICTNTSVTQLTPINISTKRVVEILKNYIKEPTFIINDDSKDEKMGCLNISEKTYKKYREFQSKYGYKDQKACTRHYSFRSKDINTITDVNIKNDFIVFLIESVLYEQKWDRKFALMDLYKEEKNADKRIENLKTRGLSRFDYTGCLSVDALERANTSGTYRLLGFSVEDDTLGIKVYQNGKYAKFTMSWEQADVLITERVFDDSIILKKDKEEYEHYFAECFEKIKGAMENTSMGLPEEYLSIQKDAYESGRKITSQEYKELSIMNALCRNYNDRHRKYLKEAMSQPNLTNDEKIAFLQMYMNKSGICGYSGNFDGWFKSPTEKGFTITSVNNPLTPFQGYGSQKIQTYDYVKEFDVSWDEALLVFETVCCNDKWEVRDRESGWCGRLPEGTIEAYNNFKAEHNFVEMYDTSNDLDEPLRKNEQKKVEENEQIDMFSFMKNSKSKGR